MFQFLSTIKQLEARIAALELQLYGDTEKRLDNVASNSLHFHGRDYTLNPAPVPDATILDIPTEYLPDTPPL